MSLVARLRWPLLAVVWLVQAPTHWDIRQGDWHYSVEATRLFGLHVFARHSELTMGPLTVAVAWVLQLGGTNGLARALFLGWLLAPGALILLERAALRVRPAERLAIQLTTLVGGAALLQVWQRAFSFGHLDDVLTMFFAALAVWAVASRHDWVLAGAVALATLSKPWGILLLPLCFAPSVRRPVATAGIACAVVVLPWLPLGLGRYTQAVDPASGLFALGVHAAQMPGWVRPAQVAGGLALAAWCVRRGGWGGALAGALAARLALDPQVYGYYTASFVLAALALDLLALRRPVPVCSLTVYAALETVPQWVHDGALLGRLRVAAALVLAGAAVISSEGWGRPTSCTTR